MIELFTDRIEDISSQHPDLKSTYYQGLLLGLFHTSTSIRESCFTRLRHHFEIPTPKNEFKNIKDPFSIPFDNEGVYSISAYDSSDKGPSSSFSSSSSSSSKVVTAIRHGTSGFELKDIRKLADISLFSDFDITIRVSALHQLVSIVSSDYNLLYSIENNWIERVASTSMSRIENLLKTTTNSSALLPHEEKEFISLLLAFFSILIQKISYLRGNIDFSGPLLSSNNQSGKIRIHILIKIVLSSGHDTSEFMSVLRAKCGIILSLILTNPACWNLPDDYGLKFQSTGSTIEMNQESQIIPSF